MDKHIESHMVWRYFNSLDMVAKEHAFKIAILGSAEDRLFLEKQIIDFDTFYSICDNGFDNGEG